MKIKKISFMIKRLVTDLKENVDLEIFPTSAPNLEEYYFYFQTKKINIRGGNRPFKYDSQGIPLIHSYIDVENELAGYYYYPITIGQYGLAIFHSYLQKKHKVNLSKFMNIADWFKENAKQDDKIGAYWEACLPKPEYGLFSPWKSAFSQSRGISILLRAWQINKNEEYLKISTLALKPFTYDIKDGGVSSFTKYGKFFEEYVAKEPTMVLDGHIFSLCGIYDFVRAVSEKLDKENHNLAKRLFNEGIESLIKWLPEYDIGFWLRFNMCKMSHYPEVDPCTIGYLRLVITQLKMLYKLTNRSELKYFYEKFKKYNKLSNILRMYFIKYKALKKMNRI